MSKKFNPRYSEFSDTTVVKRVNSMLAIREQYINNGVENLSVKFSYANRKTGALVPSVSLIPVADCSNCAICKKGCYDVRNVCFQRTVQIQRANNSAIYRTDPKRYFAEINERVKTLRFFRWHVGGDLVNRSYFINVIKIARNNSNCEMLLFTKLYGVINHYLDKGGEVPANLHVIFSDWRGAEFDNRHNLPVSSPVWFNGEHEEIERGSHTTNSCVWCPGDCSECAEIGGGCWGLKKGDTVLFEAH